MGRSDEMDGRRCSSAGQIIDPNHFPTKIKAAFIAAFSFCKKYRKPLKRKRQEKYLYFSCRFFNDFRSKFIKEKSVYPKIYAFNVSDMIRTRDLLIRSQTLYPAELHSHIRFEQNIYYSMKDKMSITFFKKFKKFG